MKSTDIKLFPDLHNNYKTQVKPSLRGRVKRWLIFPVFASAGLLLLWQCSKNMEPGNATNQSLKESLTASAQNLSKAITEISQTKGYQILNMHGANQMKSATTGATQFQDSITLGSIVGIYDYQPSTTYPWCFDCLYKLFVKTGTSSQFIVRLPQEKVFNPHFLRMFTKSDTSLKNNFVITATDYHYYFNHGFMYDYRLSAGFAINDTSIGGLDLSTSRSNTSDFLYKSDYTFPNGYDISRHISSGDTISTMTSLSNSSGILLSETTNRIKTTANKYREKQYILTIGNIKFIRTSANDSTQVFLNNILQKNAKVEIIDKTDTTASTGSISNSRDIKVTYDDGSSTTFSQLLGPSLTILSGLVSSLEDIYFASNIVDYVAWNIHRNKIQ